MTDRSDFGSLKLRGRIWWLRYRIDGKEHWETLRTTSRELAEKKAAVIADRVGRGEHQTPAEQRVTFADLETMIRTDYKVRGRRSLPRLERALTHLEEAFEATKVRAITPDRIVAYQAARLEAGAAPATVNYELAALRRMFRLALRHGRVKTAPAITISEPRNARAGYFEADDFAALRAELPQYLRPIVTFAYLTGWRVQSEVLPLRWANVDLEAMLVTLDANTTKNDEARVFPFGALPELAALLEQQRATTRSLERVDGKLIPYVFHRAGRPIKSYKNAWARAIDRAARGGKREALAPVVRPQLVGRIVHDFRRTAVRNLVRAGVDESLAMKLTGHKTRSVFDRYNITNEADLRAGVEKLASYLEPRSKAKRTRKGTTGGQSAARAIGERRS